MEDQIVSWCILWNISRVENCKFMFAITICRRKMSASLLCGKCLTLPKTFIGRSFALFLRREEIICWYRVTVENFATRFTKSYRLDVIFRELFASKSRLLFRNLPSKTLAILKHFAYSITELTPKNQGRYFSNAKKKTQV